MPCRPPMTLVSTVGHASFQTARANGPSTIVRSKRRSGPAPGAAVGACAGTDVTGGDAEAVMSTNVRANRPGVSRAHREQSAAQVDPSDDFARDDHVLIERIHRAQSVVAICDDDAPMRYITHEEQ